LVTVEPTSQLKLLPLLESASLKGGRRLSAEGEYVLFDADVFIGALLISEQWHEESDPSVKVFYSTGSRE
jgi:hypothetical protein